MSEDQEKVTVVVGRATDISHFKEIVENFLYDNFSLVIAQPLEENAGIDGKVRCVGFVIGDDVGNLTMENQAMRIKSTGGVLNATIYDSIEEAMEESQRKLGFDTGEGHFRERIETIKDIMERFPPLDSNEVEFYQTFDSLMSTGKLRPIRGLIDDKPVCVLAMMSMSEDGSEMKISLVSMLLTTPELRDEIETKYSSLGG